MRRKILDRKESGKVRDDLMVQEQVRSVWQHMVGVICLNQTGRKKVKKILPEFFKKFPDEFELLKSDKDTIAEMLKDLGMKNVRANRIWRMTEDYLEWDGRDATELFGIGKYGSDSYRIFYKNQVPENVQDKELKRYLSDLECGKIKAVRRIL